MFEIGLSASPHTQAYIAGMESDLLFQPLPNVFSVSVCLWKSRKAFFFFFYVKHFLSSL